MSHIAIYSLIGNGKKRTLLGQAEFELSQHVGKIQHDLELRLAGGPLANGFIQMQISICPIN